MEGATNTTSLNTLNSSISLASTLYLTFVFLTSILCNSLVISSIRSQRSSKVNIFLITKLGLACSDVGVAISMLPRIVHGFVSLKAQETWQEGFSTLELGMNLIFTSASLNILAIMAAQRYIAIRDPFRYRKVSKRKQLILSSCFCMAARTGVSCPVHGL